jgi:NitT/TauT family transport system permease protein
VTDAIAAAGRVGTRFRLRLDPVGLRWATLLGVLVIWELVARAFFQGSIFIAAPSRIVGAATELLRDPAVLRALRITAIEFGVAFGIAAVAGVLLGAALGVTRRLFGPMRNLLQVAFTLPQVAVYPLFVLWLGVGFGSKVAFGVTHGIFPVLLATMTATRLVDASLVDAVRAMGGGRGELLRKVVLPSILPDIVSALRVAAALSLLGVLLAELMVSLEGVGAILLLLSSSFRPARLYALVAAICLAAVAVNISIRYVEQRLSQWRTDPGS